MRGTAAMTEALGNEIEPSSSFSVSSCRYRCRVDGGGGLEELECVVWAAVDVEGGDEDKVVMRPYRMMPVGFFPRVLGRRVVGDMPIVRWGRRGRGERGRGDSSTVKARDGVRWVVVASIK